VTAGAAQAPAGVVAGIASLGTRDVAPCGGGSMAWRAWGRGRPLVLLHGASGSWTHWIRNVVPLAERCRVIAPDMPGFGDSTALPAAHTADALADLVVEGLDAILPEPASFDLAGFSFGGIIAGGVAARLGARVRTLMLFGAGGLALPKVELPPLLRPEPGMTAARLEHVHRENLRALMLGDGKQADDLAVFVHMDNVRRARFKSAGIPDSDALVRVLPAITARIVAAYGARDAFVGEYLEERRRILSSGRPGLDFRVIAGAGHWITYEAAGEINAMMASAM
jgi:pimeloyl-ACP methyl ester carboxylesterase